MSTEHLPTDQPGATGTNIQLPRVDSNEFEEAFEVFSGGCPYMMKDNIPLFLKSIGLSGLKLKIDDAIKKHNNELDINELRQIIDGVIATQSCDLNQSCTDAREWPSHFDVLRAFAVFDQEGHGYIPVQQLKRFLLQAQLGFQEEELEKLIREMCDIDNDNQIDYEKFVRNVEARLQADGIKH